MKEYKIEILIVGIPILIFVIVLFLVFRKSYVENNSIKNNCKKTELVVIGNKSKATPVYDCSGVNLD